MMKKRSNDNKYDRICRLCGGSDKPQHNIFGFPKDFIDSIQFLLTVTINEWDELPHKICFRCSAKVSDFQEFQNKCLDTQKTFLSHMGAKVPKKDGNKKSARDLWEEELKKKNVSNDEYCDELVKQALASVSNLRDFDNSDDDIPISIFKETPHIPSNLQFVNVKLKLHKVDSKNFEGIKKNSNGTYTVLSDRAKSDIPKHMSLIKVRGLGDIYSCNRCENIVLSKQAIMFHKCKKMKSETKTKKDCESKNKSPTAVSNPINDKNSPIDILSNCLLVPVGNGAFAIKMNTNNEFIQNMSPELPKQNMANEVITSNVFQREDFSQTAKDQGKRRKSEKKVDLTDSPSGSSKFQAMSSPSDDSPKKNRHKRRKKSNVTDTILIDDEPVPPTKEKSECIPPYPVGLICRNTPGPKSKKQNNPQYEILPPTSPGKLVIKSLKTSSSNDNQINNDEHFFTFVNLDIKPNYPLQSEQSLQESQISTTKILSSKQPKKPKRSEVERKYLCEICSLPFTKQKKLTAHILSHFENTDV